VAVAHCRPESFVPRLALSWPETREDGSRCAPRDVSRLATVDERKGDTTLWVSVEGRGGAHPSTRRPTRRFCRRRHRCGPVICGVGTFPVFAALNARHLNFPFSKMCPSTLLAEGVAAWASHYVVPASSSTQMPGALPKSPSNRALSGLGPAALQRPVDMPSRRSERLRHSASIFRGASWPVCSATPVQSCTLVLEASDTSISSEPHSKRIPTCLFPGCPDSAHAICIVHCVSPTAVLSSGAYYRRLYPLLKRVVPP
jgi:hypothetical protein